MISLTDEQIKRAVKLLEHLPGEAQKVMASAMNRAIEGARTAASKAVRGEYRVSSERVKKTMTLRRATAAQLTAEVRSVERRPSLFQYAPRPAAAGTGGAGKPTLRVGVKRSGGRKPLKGAFIVRLGPAGLHVASRTGKKRMPIEVHYGPAVPQLLGVESVKRHVEAVAQQRLDARLDHDIGRAIDAAGKAAGR